MATCLPQWRGHHPCLSTRASAEGVLSQTAICWEISAFVGSLRILGPLTREIGEAVHQLKPSFRTPFLYIFANPLCGYQQSAGARWQLGTETWEPLPPLSLNHGGLLSGNVEIVFLKSRLYALTEAIKCGVKDCNLQVFDPVSWDWTLLATVPIGEYEALLEIDDCLYILGRSLAKANTWVPQLSRYNPADSEQKLEVLPPVLTPRYYVGAGVLNGGLYAVGGHAASLPASGAGSAKSLAVAERFLPGRCCDSGGPWESLPPMQFQRFLCKVIALKGCLYVLGGLTTAGIETALERFDPMIGSWSLLAPMPAIKGAMEVAECGGRILAFGGSDFSVSPQHEVQRYDPLVNRWTKLPNIGSGSAAIESAAVVGVPDDLFAVFTEVSMRDSNIVIQRYHDQRVSQPVAWHVPDHRGRLRVVMAADAE